MKRILTVLALSVMLILSCSNAQSSKKRSGKLRVALVLAGFLGDKSFNDSSYMGAQQAQKDFGVEVKVMESKVPAEWEPVIPACVDIVISVIGLDCLGQPISQSAYRMERTSEFLKKSLEAPITEEDIVKIATSICGLFKDVEERVYRVYLNKSDVLTEKAPAEHIVEELEKKHTVAAYGSLWEE